MMSQLEVKEHNILFVAKKTVDSPFHLLSVSNQNTNVLVTFLLL